MTDTHAQTATATEQLNESVERYFAAWNESDDDARASHLAEAFADAARYVDPLSDVSGHDEISTMMGDAQQQYPGMSVQRTTPIDAHHDVVRFGWEITTSDGAQLVTGIDVCQVADDGRLADVRGFFGADAG